MHRIRRSILRATNSLLFITVVLYFLGAIYKLPFRANPCETAFHIQGHHVGHPVLMCSYLTMLI